MSQEMLFDAGEPDPNHESQIPEGEVWLKRANREQTRAPRRPRIDSC